jgi:hypothetical protein
MSIDSQTFGHICDGVWRDRAAILSRKGFVTGEAALIRAVYWRLCKAGGKPDKSINEYDPAQTRQTYQMVVNCMLKLFSHPRFDGAPFLEALVQRYLDETETATKRLS